MIDLFCVYAFDAVRQSENATLHTFDIDLWGTNPIGSVGGFSPKIDQHIKHLARKHSGRFVKETSGNGARVLQIRHPNDRATGRTRINVICDLAEWGIEYGPGLDFHKAHHTDHTDHHETPGQTDNPHEHDQRQHHAPA